MCRAVRVNASAVLIQTGPEHHLVVGTAAAEAGKHIFMEKPCAASVEEAMAVEKAVRDAGVRYLIGFCNRMAPAVVRAKRLMRDPWITYCQCTDSVIHQACHNLDLAVHLFHDDLSLENLPDYRMLVFVNCFHLDDVERARIAEAVQRGGRTASGATRRDC